MATLYDDPAVLYDEADITYDGGVTVASVLQIVDPDFPSTVLFDLNDQLGANSALYGSVTTYLLADPDLGVPALKETGISDVAKPLAFNRQATAEFKFHMSIRGTSYDNIATAAGVLNSYLADGCVMKWQPNSSTQTRYIDILPSPTPALFAGRELTLNELTVQLMTPQGVEVRLERLAYTRAAKLDPATNVLLNSTPLRDNDGDGLPDSWTKLSTPTLTIDSTKNSLHVVAGAATRGVYQATGAASASATQVWTLAADVLVTSGTLALRLDWRTNADANISNSDQTTTAAVWTRVSVTGTAPATTDHIRATLMSSGAAATFDVRNIQLELASAATPYRVAAQTLALDPATAGFAQLIPVYNPSDAPSPCELVVAFPFLGVKMVEVDFALLSDRTIPGARNISDYLNGPSYAQLDTSGNGWTRTFGTGETTSVADAQASGGNTAEVVPSSAAAAAIPTKRVTLTRTTLLDSMRGRWKVYVRILAEDQQEFNLQLHWGAGTVAGEVNDAVTHDTTNTVAATWGSVYVDLGDIELPREKNITIGQLTLDLYTWQTSGAASSHKLDYLVFVPTDDSAIATVPGASSVTLKGKYLTTPPFNTTADPGAAWVAGAAKSGAMRLNANHEAAGYGLNTGAFVGSANTRHNITFDYHWTMTNSSITAIFGVANVTDDSSADWSFGLVNSGSDTTNRAMDDIAGKSYQPRVAITSFGPNSGHVDVDQITIESVPYIPQNGKMRSDPGSLPSRSVVEQLDSSGNVGLEMDSTGTPFWLPPGLSLIYMTAFDVPLVGYNENGAGLSRTYTITPTVYPRFWT